MKLAKKEKERKALVKNIGQIKGMRRGSVSEQLFRVKLKGKKGFSRRGPYYIHTTKIAGKTIGKRIRPEEVKKYRKEINNFRKFQKLTRRLVEVCEEICRMRRVK